VTAVVRSDPISVSRIVADPETTITPRQLELLALYASGYSYSEIGAAKFMSYEGVKSSLTRALARTGARNLTHLCVIACEAGMIRRSPQGIYEPVADLRVAGE
jgi:DNA-binding NarL/FixJ family response regulator